MRQRMEIADEKGVAYHLVFVPDGCEQGVDDVVTIVSRRCVTLVIHHANPLVGKPINIETVRALIRASGIHRIHTP